jgi:hypothetical protein
MGKSDLEVSITKPRASPGKATPGKHEFGKTADYDEFGYFTRDLPPIDQIQNEVAAINKMRFSLHKQKMALFK